MVNILLITVFLFFCLGSNSILLIQDKLPETIENWYKDTKVLEFGPENLFDYIDGDADRYLPYNFQKLTVVFYKNKNQPDEEIEIQIYQMKTPLDAFGIYSVHRNRDKEIFPYGNDGTIGQNQAIFYQSQYFIKLSGIQLQNSSSPLKLFGKVISQLLPSEKLNSPELECLNIPEKIERSECYLAKDVLAQNFFPRGITALFKTSKGNATAFIIFFDNNETAKKGWENYKNYLDEMGAEYQTEQEEIQIMAPASETAIATLYKNRIIGLWLPDGNIPELKAIYSKIKLCFIEKTKADTSK